MMGNDQISQFLTVILILLIAILFILLTVFIILTVKRKNESKPAKSTQNNPKTEVKKKDSGYNRQSIFEFMEFDKVEDNMIVRKNGNKYIMAIECQGVNYDLMSGLEKNSVEQGFLQFLNTLRYPIQLYIQTRTVNLESSINTYKQRVNEIKSDYMRKQMEYNSVANSGNQPPKIVENARFEMVKAQNLYEYGMDIIQNTERMNFNKNILKKHYYVIISYTPEDINKTDYAMDEVKNMAFSELYTKAQHIDKDDIESIEKSKQKKIGGIIYRVKYKSESNKNVVYEYTWCGDYTGENYYHNMFLMLTNKHGDGLDENKTKHKYPIIQKRIVD